MPEVVDGAAGHATGARGAGGGGGGGGTMNGRANDGGATGGGGGGGGGTWPDTTADQLGKAHAIAAPKGAE